MRLALCQGSPSFPPALFIPKQPPSPSVLSTLSRKGLTCEPDENWLLVDSKNHILLRVFTMGRAEMNG
jgi:hypothetical protein